MINQALIAAIAAFPALFLPAGTIAPYFLFNPTTGICSFYVDASYLETAVLPVKFFMNFSLYSYFDNFINLFDGQNLPNHKDVQLVVRNLYGSNSAPLDPSIPAGQFKMSQETQALFRWQDLATLQFQSNLIPVRHEYVTGVNNSMQVYNQGNAGTGQPTTSLLTDFCPIDTDTNLIRSNLIYNPTGEYRLAEMLDSPNGLSNLDLTINWTDKQNRVYIYLIPPQQSVTVKLLFILKSTYRAKGCK
jgi:hypothetical protein